MAGVNRKSRWVIIGATHGCGQDTTEPDALCLGLSPEPTAGLALCAGGGFIPPNAELPLAGSLVPSEGQGRGALQQGSVEKLPGHSMDFVE